MTASGARKVLIVDGERHLADLYAGWLADAYPVEDLEGVFLGGSREEGRPGPRAHEGGRGAPV